MTLIDEVGLIEAERDRFRQENETLKTRLAMQAGALEESRAQCRQLIARNEKLKGYATQLREHIYTFHGALDRIAKKDSDLAEADRVANPSPATEAITPPVQVETIKKRIKRIMGSEANGQAHGQA